MPGIHMRYVRLGQRATLGDMAGQYDFSYLTDAELDTMLANVTTHINRVLSGAQSGTVGEGRSFRMATLPELRDMASALSAEKRLRGDTGGDFILGSFGQASGVDADSSELDYR